MTDMGTRFSPAWPDGRPRPPPGPSPADLVGGPPDALRPRCAGRWILPCPSMIESHTGLSAWPSTMTASSPAYLSSAAKWPPMCPLATSGFGQQVGKRVVIGRAAVAGGAGAGERPRAEDDLVGGIERFCLRRAPRPRGPCSRSPFPLSTSRYLSAVSSVLIRPVDEVDPQGPCRPSLRGWSYAWSFLCPDPAGARASGHFWWQSTHAWAFSGGITAVIAIRGGVVRVRSRQRT